MSRVLCYDVVLLLVLWTVGARGGLRRLRAQRSALQEGEGRTASGTGGFFFNYENHGGDWKIGQCASRDRQSPIDFAGAAPWGVAPSEEFFYDYTSIEGTVNVQNTGHAIAVELANQGYGGVWYRDNFYALTAVTFHMHSEHTFNGEPLPLEVHIVHRSDDSERALIIALPVGFYVDPGVTYTPVGNQVTCGSAATKTRSFPTFTPEQCKKTCSGVATCLAYVTAEAGNCPMCVMYEETDCSERFQIPSACSGNMTAYNKNIAQRDGYLPLGAGHCTATASLEQLGTSETPDGTVALWDCKVKCSLSPACTFISVSTGGTCRWFKGGTNLCKVRPEGQEEWSTFQKVDAEINIPLALLLGPDELPAEGEKLPRQMPFPADILPDLVSGGTFFTYEGSLTAPPCTEAATWLVRQEPLAFSRDQHTALHDKIYEATSEFGNFRAVMPLMGRRIGVAAGVPGVPPAAHNASDAGASPAPAPAPALAPPPAAAPAPTSRSQAVLPMWAEREAEDAVGWAYQATQMADSIGQTLQAFPPPGFASADIPEPPPDALAPAGAGAAGPLEVVAAPPGLAGGGAPAAGLLSVARPYVAAGGATSAGREMAALLGASRTLAARSLGVAERAEASLA